MNHDFIAAVVALTRCEGLDLSLGKKHDARPTWLWKKQFTPTNSFGAHALYYLAIALCIQTDSCLHVVLRKITGRQPVGTKHSVVSRALWPSCSGASRPKRPCCPMIGPDVNCAKSRQPSSLHDSYAGGKVFQSDSL
jgi:hypothetical protein